jgi:hypothetical protein
VSASEPRDGGGVLIFLIICSKLNIFMINKLSSLLMVLDNRQNVMFSFEVVVWLVCTAISLLTYYYKIDIGIVGIITWVVFLGGILYCILKALSNFL